MKLIFIFGTFLIIINAASAAKILFVLPIASKSHKNVFDPLIEALALRNHNITVISPLKTTKFSSVRELFPAPANALTKVLENPMLMRKKGKVSFLISFNNEEIEKACKMVYENQEIKDLMNNDTFDLVILNGFGNTCAIGLVGHFRVPYIVLFTMAAPASSVAKLGNHFPPSFVPSSFNDLTDTMTFFERVQNLLINWIFHVIGIYKYEFPMQALYQKYLPNVPSIHEVQKNMSMIFMNSHLTMTYPRPLLPNVIEVGGMHCRPAQPLSKDLDDFLSGAEDGFILFSLGSIVQAHTLPEEIRKVFINVFSKLKQRIIWKWEVEEMDDLPPNVIISKWLPQQDILGHKNIRLFMTHGGLLSTQEAVYHGVPLIGIPIFGDQDLNMKQAEKVGFCLTLEILKLTEERLESVVRRVLNEPQFTERAKSLSKVFRDQPQTSLERAVFWTEYVIRHKGAPELQSPARDLNFWQYHSLDSIGFLLSLLLLVLWISKFCFFFTIRNLKKLCCKSKPQESDTIVRKSSSKRKQTKGENKKTK